MAMMAATWVADYDGEGQEQGARDGGDSRVAMMTAAKMAAAEDSSGGWRRMTAADNDGMQDRAADCMHARHVPARPLLREDDAHDSSDNGPASMLPAKQRPR